MSHWKGNYRKKQFQQIQNRARVPIKINPLLKDQIGRTDEQLLRIYYFRDNTQSYQTNINSKNQQKRVNSSDNLISKRYIQKMFQQQQQIIEDKEQKTNYQSSNQKHLIQKYNKFNFSDCSQNTNLSQFSSLKRA